MSSPWFWSRVCAGLLYLCLGLTPGVLAQQSHQTMPSATTSTFNTDLQNYLLVEPGDRLGDRLAWGFVVSGGTHATSGTMTSAAFATVAYGNNGHYISQASAAINYTTEGCAADDTAWVAVTESLTAAPGGNFSRVSGTRYVVDCTNTAQPALPSGAAWLMQVRIVSSAIDAVVDIGQTYWSGAGIYADNTHGSDSPHTEQQTWWGDAIPAGYVVTGCTPTTSATTTTGTFACEAYVPGSGGEVRYVTQATQTVGPLSGGDGVYWIAVHQDLSTVPAGGWTRQTGTHYLWLKNATKPTQPANSLIIAEVEVGDATTGQVDRIGPTAARVPFRGYGLRSLAEFGGDSAGTNDSSQALQDAIDSGSCIYVPEGTWYIPTSVTQTAGTVCLIGAGMGKSTLLAKAAPVAGGANCTGQNFSYNILKLTSPTGVYIQGITFDGGVGSAPTAYCDDGSYTTLAALLDITSGTQITLRDVEWTKFNGQIPITSAGGTMDPGGFLLNQKQGPLWIYGSSHIHLFNNHLTSPSWVEGLYIMESGPGVVDGLVSTAGSDDHATYGVSTPLHIQGATTATRDWVVINSRITNHNGSWLSLWGTNNFEIANNVIRCTYGSTKDGFCSGANATPDNFNPTAAAPAGLPIASVPVFNNLHYHHNIHENLNGYGITYGRHAAAFVVKMKNVTIDNNIFNSAPGGVYGGATDGVTISNNTFKGIREFLRAGGYGDAINTSQLTTDMLVKDNYIDGTLTETDGVNGCDFDNSVAGDCKTRHGIVLYECERCVVEGNVIVGSAVSNILAAVLTADDGVYGQFVLKNNTIRNVTVLPVTPIQLGTDATHRLSTAFVTGNTVDGLPLNGANTANFVLTTYINEEQAFNATRTSTQAIANGDVLDTIIFNATVNTPTGEYDSTTGIYTAQVRGMYTFHTTFTLGQLETTKRVEAFTSVNGVSIGPLCQAWNWSGGSLDLVCAGSNTVVLASGDTVEIELRHNGVAATLNVLANARFSGYYIGRN